MLFGHTRALPPEWTTPTNTVSWACDCVTFRTCLASAIGPRMLTLSFVADNCSADWSGWFGIQIPEEYHAETPIFLL
eukprot:1010668-Pyramimonas_sp.AAC.1